MAYEIPLLKGALPETSATRLPNATLRPLADRVLVERQPDARTSASGLHLPFAHSDDVQIATVIAVGANVKELKRGDRVAHVRVVGVKHKMGERSFAIMREDELLGVIEGEMSDHGVCPHCRAVAS